MNALLSIRVTPGVRQEFLEQLADGNWKIGLRARAVEGQANKALCEKIAELLTLSRSQITVVRGEKNRQKMIKITGFKQEEVTRRLSTLLANSKILCQSSPHISSRFSMDDEKPDECCVKLKL